MKTLRVATLALAFPVGLAAQQPSATSQANPITNAFRNRITALHRNVAQAFDSIPADKFSYEPTPAQQSIGFIAQHLVTDNYLFCNQFGDRKATRTVADTSTADSVKATWPKDTLVSKLKESITFCQSALEQLEDAKLAEQVTLTFRGNSRNVARASMVLGHALDLADHYSQLANYMRLNNMLPPTALPRPQQSGGN
jgi:uncharacterized damage-inducible protein DinB